MSEQDANQSTIPADDETLIDPLNGDGEADEDEDGLTYRVVNLLYATWTLGRFTFERNILTLHSRKDMLEFAGLMRVMPAYIQDNVVMTSEEPGKQPVHVILSEIAAKRRRESDQAANASGVKVVDKELAKGAAGVLPRQLLMPAGSQPSTIRGASTATDAGEINKPKV